MSSQPSGLWHGARNSNLSDAITRFVATTFLCSFVMTVNALMTNPLLSDPAGVLVSAILAASVPLLTARSGSRSRQR